uniref:BolA family member 3 n=1 Tax=Astatotilapia calliptera TaxID=8154 RepID=A0AAX7TMT5_ASTCA
IFKDSSTVQLPHEELLTGSDGAKNKDITQIDRITCFSSLCLLATPLFPFIVRNRSAPFNSGGCGAMYEIHIESSEFKGKRTVQQHQLVNQALKDEIQNMHGLRIFTDVPQH